MGVASHRVWQRTGGGGGARLALGLYAAQLALNLAWQPLFFSLESINAAAADITLLLPVLGATVLSFSKIDRTAGLLMLPYLGFCAFAAALTWRIKQLNVDTD